MTICLYKILTLLDWANTVHARATMRPDLDLKGEQ